MSNQHDGQLKAAILEAIKKPAGMKTAEIKGYTSLQVGRMVQKLTKAGFVFRAQVPGKFGRHFDTMARAEEFAAKTAPVIQSVQVPGKRGPGHMPGEPVIPEALKAQQGPSFPENRWIDGDVPKVFGALKYGQYLEAA